MDHNFGAAKVPLFQIASQPIAMSQGFRTQPLTQQVIFVDGLAGCGKTMLAPIVSSFDRVELMTYAFEIQWYCAQYFMGELSLHGAKTLIQLQADLKLYNTMMGREVNFRPSDLSSVDRHVDPKKYYDRIKAPGDEVIPDRIRSERPIMNLCVHNLIPYCEPLIEAFGDKAYFIDVVRHPLYMLRQQALNFERLIPNPRDIELYIRHNDQDIPYYFKGFEDDYTQSKSPYDKAVFYSYHLGRRSLEQGEKLQLLRIPFERFVLDPDPYMEKIRNFLKVKDSPFTAEKLKSSNVPRTKIAEGIDLDIYRRCGWEPPKPGLSERGELNHRYEIFSKEVSPRAKKFLDEMIHDYENKFWKPD